MWQGMFLATCGQNRIVNIFNRQGEEATEIPMDGTGCAHARGTRRRTARARGDTLRVWRAQEVPRPRMGQGR